MKEVNQHIYHLIGIGDTSRQIDAHAITLIEQHRVFSGGKRHYQLVKEFLPEEHRWIEISGSMGDVIRHYQEVNQSIVVFASGDPLFFGFANTLQNLLPNATLNVIPWFNSIQRLCHKALINYSDITTISLHGRNWKRFDQALMKGATLVGLLTDKNHGPQHIAQRMINHGYDHFEIIIGEALDGENERVTRCSLQEVSTLEINPLNCVVLRSLEIKREQHHFPDDQYVTLPNRPGMMTKLPIRLMTIQALELHSKHRFWDIGSCTGSIAIEALLKHPHLTVTAFEKRTECREIIQQNIKRHKAIGIDVRIDDFFNLDLSSIKRPDAIFIGGHGNRLEELIRRVHPYLTPQGIIVMNTVQQSSYDQFIATCHQLNYSVEQPIRMAINDHNTIYVLVAKKQLR